MMRTIRYMLFYRPRTTLALATTFALILAFACFPSVV